MKKLKFFFLTLLVLACSASFAQSSVVVRKYIDTFKEAAIEEMKRTGVPAAITLAQGIHETGAGQSDLVRKSNNHFGIKCKAEWKGETVSHDDDAKGECFRKYTDPIESYKDHSDFLKNRPHYASLFTLDPTDYEGWAYGLKKAGYATNPKYPQILIRIINEYSLQDYTMIALGRKVTEQPAIWASSTTTDNEAKKEVVLGNAVPKPIAYPQGVFEINNTKVVYVLKGTPYLMVAEQYGVKLKRLFDYNDMPEAEVAATDQLVYLQHKRKKGANETYTFKGTETVQQVAQQEGIRLENLLRFNRLEAGVQPVAGTRLYLQQAAPDAVTITNITSKDKTVARVKPNEKPVAKGTTFVTHTVQPKETLYAIAKRYSVTINDVLRWNNLDTAHVKTGQKLRIKK